MPKYKIQYLTEIVVLSNNQENALRKAVAQNKIAIESVVMVNKVKGG